MTPNMPVEASYRALSPQILFPVALNLSSVFGGFSMFCLLLLTPEHGLITGKLLVKNRTTKLESDYIFELHAFKDELISSLNLTPLRKTLR